MMIPTRNTKRILHMQLNINPLLEERNRMLTLKLLVKLMNRTLKVMILPQMVRVNQKALKILEHL